MSKLTEREIALMQATHGFFCRDGDGQPQRLDDADRDIILAEADRVHPRGAPSPREAREDWMDAVIDALMGALNDAQRGSVDNELDEQHVADFMRQRLSSIGSAPTADDPTVFAAKRWHAELASQRDDAYAALKKEKERADRAEAALAARTGERPTARKVRVGDEVRFGQRSKWWTVQSIVVGDEGDEDVLICRTDKVRYQPYRLGAVFGHRPMATE